MPFVPLARQSPSDFPRVSTAEQASRDADAEHIVLAEFSEDMPADSRIALEKEYRRRFGKEPPVVPRGFVPLADGEAKAPRGFVPLEPERPSVLRNVLLNNPATAIAETGANLLSQGVALPAAGLAGIGAAAGKALGLTDAEPADVVHTVGGALTYQPRGEMGAGGNGCRDGALRGPGQGRHGGRRQGTRRHRQRSGGNCGRHDDQCAAHGRRPGGEGSAAEVRDARQRNADGAHGTSVRN
jgi:hypothetical protein